VAVASRDIDRLSSKRCATLESYEGLLQKSLTTLVKVRWKFSDEAL
jgi:hypothetical protein